MVGEPDPANGGDRAKATRLRRQKRDGTIGAADLVWIDQYEAAREKNHRDRVRAADVGASQSKSSGVKTVEFKMHEERADEAQAIGSGSAASVAAGALVAREEGRRIDSLLQGAIDASTDARNHLVEAVKVYRSVCISMRDRLEILEKSHVETWDSNRRAMLARTEAEIVSMRKDAEGDEDRGAEAMFERILARYFDGKGLTDGGERATHRGRPPTNGAD